MRHFAAPWDRALRVTTWLAATLMLAASLVTLWLPSLRCGPAPPFIGVVGLVTLGALVASWALAPSGYSLIAGELRIRRRGLPPLRLALASVTEVSLLPALGPAMRVFGSGGLFGYYGRYHSRALGSFRLYATRRRELVALRTSAGVWVITPEPTAAFLDALRADAPHVRITPAAGGDEHHDQ